MKTCEEYVLKVLEDTKNELDLVKKENEGLKEKLYTPAKENVDVDEEKERKIILVEKTNVYYQLHYKSDYNFNDILLKNGYTNNTLIKDAFTDDKKLDEFMNLKDDDNWSNGKLAYVSKNYYDIKISDEDGNTAIIGQYTDKQFWVKDLSDSVLLDYKEAQDNLKIKVRNEIEKYFKYYSKQFDEKLEKYKEKKEKGAI